jgi:hypothetical protein
MGRKWGGVASTLAQNRIDAAACQFELIGFCGVYVVSVWSGKQSP